MVATIPACTHCGGKILSDKEYSWCANCAREPTNIVIEHLEAVAEQAPKKTRQNSRHAHRTVCIGCLIFTLKKQLESLECERGRAQQEVKRCEAEIRSLELQMAQENRLRVDL